MSFFLLLKKEKDILKEDILKNDCNFAWHQYFFFYYGSQWCQTPFGMDVLIGMDVPFGIGCSNRSSKYLPR